MDLDDAGVDQICSRVVETFYNQKRVKDYKGIFPMVYPLCNKTGIPNNVHQLLALLALRYDCTLSVIYYCDTGEYLVSYTNIVKQPVILERLSEAGFTCEVETSYRKTLIRRLAKTAQSSNSASASASADDKSVGLGDD